MPSLTNKIGSISIINGYHNGNRINGTYYMVEKPVRRTRPEAPRAGYKYSVKILLKTKVGFDRPKPRTVWLINEHAFNTNYF